jgi:hypothetical protein
LKSFTSRVSLNSEKLMLVCRSLMSYISGAYDRDSNVIPSTCNFTVFSQEKTWVSH